MFGVSLEIDPLNAAIHVQLGHARKEQGDLTNAERSYRAALELAPADDDVHLQIGHLEKRKGRLGHAALAYRAAAELNPLNADAIAEYAGLAPHLDLPPLPFTGSEASGGLADHIRPNGSPPATVLPGPDIPNRSPVPLELRACGDQAREKRRWDEAVQAYQAYLAVVPKDFAIWVQLGHALKENGDLATAEAAYRTALAYAPDDADIHLQLGHLFKICGETAKAVTAYRRSFELHPLRTTWSELVATDRTTDPLVMPPPGRQRAPAIMLDISDLLIALSTWDFISGIQRVQLGLLSSLLSAADAADCQFVAWRHKALWVLSKTRLNSLVPGGSATAPSFQKRQQIIVEIETTSVLYAPVTGDVLVSTGVIYFEPDLPAEREQLKRAGVFLGAYFHDFIPLTHPEFCAGNLTRDFSSTASEALVHLDFVLTVSRHVANETRRLLKQAGYPEIPVQPVPLAHIFGGETSADDQCTPAIDAPCGREYVLCVGALSVHKNQSFLVQVWQLLVQEGYEPPVLVLAGAHSFGSDEVRIRLAWSDNVGGRVRLVEKPSDEELAVLYRNCLFTIFPSLVEGWGLPIGESLVQGKLYVASRLASMPEVGGDFAVYIDPYNVRGCADVLRELFEHRSKLAALEERIKSRFKPRTWQEHSQDFLREVRKTAAAIDARDAPLGILPAGQAIAARKQTEVTETERSLPPYAALTQVLKHKAVLVRGWHPGESWGTWMAGRQARVCFYAELASGSVVKVVLQFVAAPWTLGNTLTIRSTCGAAVRIPLPDGPPSEVRWSGQRYKETVGAIDCIVADDRSIDLVLELNGPLRHPWWGEERAIWVGLSRLGYIPYEAAQVHRYRPHQWVRPTGFVNSYRSSGLPDRFAVDAGRLADGRATRLGMGGCGGLGRVDVRRQRTPEF